MEREWGRIRTSTEERLIAVLIECDYLLEETTDPNCAEAQVHEYAEFAERLFIDRWGRWHEKEYGPSYVIDDARAYARWFLYFLSLTELHELEDREVGVPEELIPDALLQELVASSERSRQLYLEEQRLIDTYVAEVMALTTVDMVQEFVRLRALSEDRRALLAGGEFL